MIRSIKLDDYVETYQWMVFQTCRRYTSNTDAAWEAYQDTFLALTRRHESLDLTEDLGPWLRETARRCCQAVTRRRFKTQLAPLPSEPFSQNEAFQDQLETSELTTILEEELACLSETDQKILKLVYHDQKSNRDVATEIDCPKGSAHARIETATNNLRQRMTKRGVALSVLLLLFLFSNDKTAVASGLEDESNPGPDLPKAPTESSFLLLLSIAASIAIAIVTLVTVHDGNAGVTTPIKNAQQITVPATNGSTGTAEGCGSFCS